MATPFYVDNDFGYFAKLQQIDPATGAKSAVTSGSVVAFIATSNAADAVAAAAPWSMSPVHQPDNPGKWLIFFDASANTLALFDTHSAGAISATLYLIVVLPNGIRIFEELAFFESKEAD